ncbi:MAG: putative regulator of amino acid metabolism with ACT domain [Crocinitomicaceae bacterium]|jgi:predicted regulator of amino acid metabolism with ACT domain
MQTIIQVESETAKYFIENDILNIVYKDVVIVELSHVMDNLALRLEFQKGKKMLVLADVSGVWDYTVEAQEFITKKPVNDLAIAYAVVTGKSMPIRIMANFFVKFNKSTVPTKLFSTKEKALDWLETLHE